jgi:DNA-binding NarL/FixJ family response regulator
MKKRLKNIYIIEDDENLRDSIATQLEDFFPDLDIVGASGTRLKAMVECWELEPDLAIFDIGLPDIYGLEILHFFKAKFPKIKILIYSGIADEQTADIAKLSEADGFVTKKSGMSEIRKAITTIKDGGHYISPELENLGMPQKDLAILN